MARQKTIASIEVETIALRLTVPERQLILTGHYFAGTEYPDRIRQTPEKESVPFSLDEWEDLYDRLIEDAEETDDRKRERKLDKLLEKIEELLEDFTDEAELPDDDRFVLGDDLFGGANPAGALANFFTSVGQSETGTPLCVVQLTKAQREVLAGMSTLSDDVRDLLRADAPDDAYSLNLRQTVVLGLAVSEALYRNEGQGARQLVDVSDRLGEGLVEAMRQEAMIASRPGNNHGLPAPTAVAYQLKITLEHSKPPIWRRIKVADCTLAELHVLIQIAMGWEDCHLHSFRVGETYYGEAATDAPDTIEESGVLLSSLVNSGQHTLCYWYDFGDDWWHTIKVEKSLQLDPKERLPICLKGARACPPEDVGGVWGYENFLAVLQNPKDENYRDLKEWSGGKFDPEEFDLDAINRRLASS